MKPGAAGSRSIAARPEGKLVAFVAPADADAVLAAMRSHEYGADAVVIGECVEAHAGMVVNEDRSRRHSCRGRADRRAASPNLLTVCQRRKR